jgi:hypothetical protein
MAGLQSSPSLIADFLRWLDGYHAETQRSILRAVGASDLARPIRILGTSATWPNRA